MRLPFLQVEADLLGQRGQVAAKLLGVSLPTLVGLVTLLRAYALSLAGEEVPSGWVHDAEAGQVLEIAAGWEGEPGKLVRVLAMPSVYMLEVDPTGAVRVLGMDPYAKAHALSAKARARAATSDAKKRAVSGVLRESARRTPSSAPQDVDVEEDVEEETASLPAMPGAVADEDLPQADEHAEPVDLESNVPPGRVLEAVEASPSHGNRLVLVPPEPEAKPQRAPSAQEALYANLQADRRRRCERAGKHFVDDDWKPQAKNTHFRTLVKAPEAEQEAFAAGWDAYLADDYPGGLDLPWSLTVFMRQRARWESKAANAAGGAK